MKTTLGISRVVMLSFFYVLKSEKCIVQNNPEKVEEGPLGLDCFLYMSLNLESTNYSLSWYIDGSETPVTKQPSSQIHQRGNMLWFLPARYQDSGLYECIISYRNSTRCYKNIFKISVVNNSALCFNENLFYIQSIPKASNAKIVCSDMEYFGKELDRSSIQWYKECKPVLSERFFTWETELIIKKVREDDKGKYQCKTEYTYLGNQYNVSRSIFVDVTVNPPKKQTEIMYPTNNTIEAELGSKLLIECNVSSYRNTLNDISWKVNNTHVDSLFKPRIEEGIQKEFPAGEAILYVVPLNITELKSEDYGQRFVCHAGEVAAYVSIQRPTKNVLGLIALILLIIIPVLICVLFKIEIVLWYRKSCHPFLHKKAVVNVIDETIKQSRRLIMILVPGFSSYNLLEEVPEEQLALYNALMNESAGMKVILIEMGKIKDYSNMPESIRYIKQKQGIIRWEGDFTSKRSYSTNTKFWKKVQYRMPPGHQISPELPLVPTSLNTCQATET
ncbi:interleukin-1 receptor-like 2 isoform X4 [Rhineura floridana]|uniref:interleukin-1 receptor-like 2 isoform X4 n=1 Tax=Rhineura floridana TaxID=261503 RepID=UPI002AC7FDDF|nr:interleukin-1 receptor-like 2 isoform X4 [Rhineura floridana]